MEGWMVLGGLLALAVLSQRQASLAGRAGLGFTLTDSRNLTLIPQSLGSVTITNIIAPATVQIGTAPTVTVYVSWVNFINRDVGVQIVDVNKNLVVAPMKFILHVSGSGSGSIIFQGLGPVGSWNAVMPSSNWLLRVEAGESYII
jgi:hypothetical protein